MARVSLLANSTGSRWVRKSRLKGTFNRPLHHIFQFTEYTHALAPMLASPATPHPRQALSRTADTQLHHAFSLYYLAVRQPRANHARDPHQSQSALATRQPH